MKADRKTNIHAVRKQLRGYQMRNSTNTLTWISLMVTTCVLTFILTHAAYGSTILKPKLPEVTVPSVADLAVIQGEINVDEVRLTKLEQSIATLTTQCELASAITNRIEGICGFAAFILVVLQIVAIARNQMAIRASDREDVNP